MHILADENIPAVHAAFGRYGQVETVPGRSITHGALSGVDVLLVRSVTPVGARLVRGTPVRFVGTATAGTDHLDTAALTALGVAVASAPGSNATSVVEYVLAALLACAAERHRGLEGATLGVVGAGEVGGRLVPRARALGLRVVVCDPPRAAAGHREHTYLPLAGVLRQSDVVTLHTPLVAGGPHPTAGLVGAEALSLMRPGAWLVNAARGGVADGTALEAARRSGHLGALVLDVWPGEPAPDLGLVDAADLATPHIAGYALDGKVRGTTMLEAALRSWLTARGEALPEPWDAEAALASAAPLVVTAPPPPDDAARPALAAAWLDALVRQAYPIRADDDRFRRALDGVADVEARADAFAFLRKTYPVRREWSRFTVHGEVPSALAEAVRVGLGMDVGTASVTSGVRSTDLPVP